MNQWVTRVVLGLLKELAGLLTCKREIQQHAAKQYVVGKNSMRVILAF